MTGLTSRSEPPTAPSSEEPGLDVPTVSFDFLEGRFRSAARSRLFNVVTAAVLLVTVALVFSGAVGDRLQASRAADRVATLQAGVNLDIEEIGALRQAGRATEGEVRIHVEKRAAQAATATQAQQPFADALAAIFSLPNATVRSVVFGDDAEGLTVTISGVASAPETATAASSQLDDAATYPFLTRTTQTQVQCVSTDTADACSWTWEGRFNPTSPTPRSEAFSSAYGVTPLADPAPPPPVKTEGGGS